MTNSNISEVKSINERNTETLIDFTLEGDPDKYQIIIGQYSGDRFSFDVLTQQASENFRHTYTDSFELPNRAVEAMMDFLAKKNWAWEHPSTRRSGANEEQR